MPFVSVVDERASHIRTARKTVIEAGGSSANMKLQERRTRHTERINFIRSPLILVEFNAME
jgi:hypothetical protein